MGSATSAAEFIQSAPSLNLRAVALMQVAKRAPASETPRAIHSVSNERLRKSTSRVPDRQASRG